MFTTISGPDRVWLNDGRSFHAIKLALRAPVRLDGVDFANIDVTESRFYRCRYVESRSAARRANASSCPITTRAEIDSRPNLRNTLFHNRGDAPLPKSLISVVWEASEWSWSPAFSMWTWIARVCSSTGHQKLSRPSTPRVRSKPVSIHGKGSPTRSSRENIYSGIDVSAAVFTRTSIHRLSLSTILGTSSLQMLQKSGEPLRQGCIMA